MQDAVSRLQAQQEATIKRETAVRELQAQLHHGQGHMPLQLEPSLALVSAATSAPAQVVSSSPPLLRAPHSALQKAGIQAHGDEASMDGVKRQGIFNWPGDGGRSIPEPPTAVRARPPVHALPRRERSNMFCMECDLLLNGLCVSGANRRHATCAFHAAHAAPLRSGAFHRHCANASFPPS